MDSRPNVVLVVADQFRRDGLRINGNPAAHTPHLDQLAREGVNFDRAYTTCPSCIAARASLLTGMSQERHGITGYDRVPWRFDETKTLPGLFSGAGYQTQCVGKMHVEPPRALLGFHHVLLHDGFLHDKRAAYRDPLTYDDYLPDVRRSLGPDFDLVETGLGCNGTATREWPWDERFHPTAWVTTKSIEFLRRRDPSKPFFLKVSYHRPHAPLDPPRTYFDKFRDVSLPEPLHGDWNEMLFNTQNAENPMPDDSHSRDLARKAYAALITQIDYEWNRLYTELGDLGLRENTLIVFLSDHGDMMYDHRVIRKSLPFEGACGIPLILHFPACARTPGNSGITDSRPATLADILPTLCSFCGIPYPDFVDGIPLTDAERPANRVLHGEHPHGELSNHWLTDGREKYCWFSQMGREMLFDLERDPGETHDRSSEDPVRTGFWRNKLVEVLRDRPEGYVSKDGLVVGCAPLSALPWAGTDPATR